MAEESEFQKVGCDGLQRIKRYHFSPVYPESPNASGLMNLIDEGKPVFTMVALDLLRLRFVKDMSKEKEGIKCSAYDPSLYGIITGYNYDRENVDNSWWEMTSYPVSCEWY